MDRGSHALSAELLRRVLAGDTYESAARAHELTRTAVERRAKSLVLALIRDGALAGVTESQALFVRTLRRHRGRIEEALEAYVPVSCDEPVSSPVLSDVDVQSALRRVRHRTRTPERDTAMFLILLATGLRPLEVARLEIRDYLRADGAVKTSSQLREAVATNRRLRPLFFTSSAVRDAIDAYLAKRADALAGDLAASYRGLDGADALFLNEEQRRFQVLAMATPTGTRCLCQEIHYAYRKIFRRIGYPGLSALSVRSTFMDRLSRRGASAGQIGELLGLRELRTLKRPQVRLDELVNELV
ncbi:site-specific integrase [Roseateles chitinivorans]|uniref:site-specific integrase n=1 Tax=Roseateles chitinivorans TaxID=2917965 RepID=UPI003D6702CE